MRRAMTSNRAYSGSSGSTNRERYIASSKQSKPKTIISSGGSTNRERYIASQSGGSGSTNNNNNNNNNNQNNETFTINTIVDTAKDAVTNPVETGSRIKEKYDDLTQFELLDGDLNIDIKPFSQKIAGELETDFGTFSVEGAGLLSANPSIGFQFSKSFKEGGLLDKKRG